MLADLCVGVPKGEGLKVSLLIKKYEKLRPKAIKVAEPVNCILGELRDRND